MPGSPSPARPGKPVPGSDKRSLERRIGRYRLIRPLSKGGMALVYEGRRESLAGVSPRVAIKLILPEHAASETFRELFINEARLGASMQHQNLVQIQDFDSEGDTYFLVMEYVEGLTLRKIIQAAERGRMRIPLAIIAELGRQACDGLHYAHTARDEQGRPLHLVHRDIKPSNLILNPHGVVKVLDFGISKGRLREERKGSVKGTWGYMAPEQAMGADVGPTADLFGLAVVLYELASLKPMFSDQSKEEMRRLLRDDHAARMAATLDGPTYGPLIGVLVRALQRDPMARFEDAAAFGRALGALEPDPITARDQLGRFYEELAAIDAGSKPLPAPTGDTADSLAPPTRAQGGIALGGVATFFGGLFVSLVVLGGIAAGVISLVGEGPEPDPVDEVAAPPPAAPAPRVIDLSEPAGPNGEGAPGEAAHDPVPGERPPPDEPPIPLPTAVPRVVTGDGAEEPGGPAADEGPTGLLAIDARQPAEVYLDGRFVARAPTERRVSVGVHTVTLVAGDGRRKIFEVDVPQEPEISKTWDFDRMDWR